MLSVQGCQSYAKFVKIQTCPAGCTESSKILGEFVCTCLLGTIDKVVGNCLKSVHNMFSDVVNNDVIVGVSLGVKD